MHRLAVIANHLAPPEQVVMAAGGSGMPAQLQEELKAVRAKRNFNPRKWIDAKVEKLNEYMRKGSKWKKTPVCLRNRLRQSCRAVL
jgi:hypothetical protein